MHHIGVFGTESLRIAHLLAGAQLPCTSVTTRELASAGTRPQVLVVSKQTALEAKLEVTELRERSFGGKIIALLYEVPSEEDLIELYLTGVDNCVAGSDSNDLLYAVVFAAAAERKPDRVTELSAANVTLRTLSHIVTVGDTSVNLGPTGFDVLYLFLKQVGITLSREEILAQVRPHSEVDVRMIDAIVSRVRRKLDAAGANGLKFVTVRNVGYRLDVA